MDDKGSELISRARNYAVQAHGRINHRLKYSLQPYDRHLHQVASIVSSVTDDPEMIAAAWLHDTVEDTPSTFEEIYDLFGASVGQLVMELTDVSRPGDGNRAFRKQMDRQHLALVSARAKTIKLADIIANSVDICRHDPRFGRVYLTEIIQLLDVLQEGDHSLYQRARTTVEHCRRQLDLDTALEQSEINSLDGSLEELESFGRQQGLQLFTSAFTASHVFEPLPSCDADADVAEIMQACQKADLGVVGLRRQGIICNYMTMNDLTNPTVPDPRPVHAQQLVQLHTPIADVIHILTSFSFCFVASGQTVFGVIGRNNIEKPVVRMWLFGMIMLIELVTVDLIRRRIPDDGWQKFITEGRLEKARQLLQERQRCKLPGDLLDCLQFSDKLHIGIFGLSSPRDAGYPSVSAAKRVMREMEALRDSLAHGQPITNHNWPQIDRLSRRLTLLLRETSS